MNTIIALPKDALDYVAKSVIRVTNKDFAGNTYVDINAVDVEGVCEYIVSLFDDQQEYEELIKETTKMCLKVWSLPGLGYYAPTLSKCLDYAKEGHDDLMLQHYLLLCTNFEEFQFVCYMIGRFDDGFTPEELVIAVLDEQDENEFRLKSVDIYSIFETVYLLGLLNQDEDGRYYIKHTNADSEQLKFAFDLLEGGFQDMGGTIASTILKPFLPIK